MAKVPVLANGTMETCGFQLPLQRSGAEPARGRSGIEPFQSFQPFHRFALRRFAAVPNHKPTSSNGSKSSSCSNRSKEPVLSPIEGFNRFAPFKMLRIAAVQTFKVQTFNDGRDSMFREFPKRQNSTA